MQKIMKKSCSDNQSSNDQWNHLNNYRKNNCENNSSNKCSATVTSQNKKEVKNKNKTNKIIESEDNIEFDIMEYIKKISGKFIGISLSSIKLAVSIRDEKNVKLAIDKAAEVNVPTMNYINEILKN